MKYVKPNQVSHLSDDEIEKLIKDYYDGVKIKDIIEIYKIDCQPSSFRKILPAIETEQVCLYCNLWFFRDIGLTSFLLFLLSVPNS